MYGVRLDGVRKGRGVLAQVGKEEQDHREVQREEMRMDQTEDLFQEGKGKQVKWKGKLLGWFHQEKEGITFVIVRKKSKHLFRMYNSFNLNELFLKHLIDIGVRKIILKEEDEKKIYITTPQDWFQKGFLYQNPHYELQRCLPINKFQVSK